MVLLRFTKATNKVRNGDKRQTIRLPRKNPIKLGDTLQIYVSEKLGEAKVVKIERKILKDITREDTLKDGFSDPIILKHVIKAMNKCQIDQEIDIITFDPDWVPKNKSCLKCWTGSFEIELCEDCERLPRIYQDHWKPFPEGEEE